MREYDDFVLRVLPNDKFIAEVLHAPYGTGRKSQLDFPLSETELELALAELGQLHVRRRRLDTAKMQAARTLGEKLYYSLFRDKILVAFEACRHGAARVERGLRLRLNLARAPELMGLPWEFLFDGTRFVCASTRTPIIRQLEIPSATYPPLQVTPPLTILAVACSPADLPALDVEKEIDLLQSALSSLDKRGLARVDILQNAELLHVQQALRDNVYHIFHFIGHGDWNDERQDGVLAFVADDGNADIVTAERLGVILSDHDAMRLAFINACRGAFASSGHPFSSVAATLVERGIPAVVAMQFEISDRAAVILAQSFYDALSRGCSVEEALGEARKSLFDGNEVEWAFPVLFMQSDHGRLFDIVSESGIAQNHGPTPPNLQIDQYLYGKRRPFEPDVVRVPGGSFLMGSSDEDQFPSDDEKPQHEVNVPTFYIARFPVTIAQYRIFLEQTGHRRPPSWEIDEPPSTFDFHPIVDVSWFDALAFCRWLAELTGKPYSLPTESEWEKAARGTDGRLWPWGNTWHPSRCNSGHSGIEGTKRVDAYFDSASPYEVLDLVGNVWEWCQSAYKPYPYQSSDGREALDSPGRRVIRGGSFLSTEREARCASRGGFQPTARAQYLGFRVVIRL